MTLKQTVFSERIWNISLIESGFCPMTSQLLSLDWLACLEVEVKSPYKPLLYCRIDLLWIWKHLTPYIDIASHLLIIKQKVVACLFHIWNQSNPYRSMMNKGCSLIRSTGNFLCFLRIRFGNPRSLMIGFNCLIKWWPTLRPKVSSSRKRKGRKNVGNRDLLNHSSFYQNLRFGTRT